MFGFFSSVEKQMRSNAANWLELAEKIFHYRRDELSASDRSDLQQKTEALRAQLRDRADASKLKLGIEALEPTLKRTGGTFYPRSTLQEYVEFFVVAAIVVLGIRAYFLQPFKIPTNSMWPTYYGMTPEVYQNPADAPKGIRQAARFVLFGAQRREMIAPASGRISIPMNNGSVYFSLKQARKWLVIPTRVREYRFEVEGAPVTVQVPEDFQFEPVIEEAFGIRMEDLRRRAGPFGQVWVPLERKAEIGEVFLSFDIMTGDQLFVDRVSCHFMQPTVGDGFVFRTRGIAGIGSDQYYVKRLVGVPGDTLEVQCPTLLRNGVPIKGAAAFDKNARMEAPYRGYAPVGNFPWSLMPGQKVKIPADQFYAMGDNSYNSSDSRFWGFIPDKNVVGRPLFIYFPFTKRWGPAR